MSFALPDLPYASDALEPHISAETLEYHHGKHHRAYVSKLNGLIAGSEYEDRTLEEIIRSASGELFNNAGQVWNHSFYWNCLKPGGGDEPDGALAAAVNRDFGSFDALRKKFTEAAIGTFGSGWAWLVQTPGGSLEVVSTPNAESPLTGDSRPLLTCDVWEHAYYIDYRNARPKYLEAFWSLVDWGFVAGRLKT